MASMDYNEYTNAVAKIIDGFSGENRIKWPIMGSRKRNFVDELYRPPSLELVFELV